MAEDRAALVARLRQEHAYMVEMGHDPARPSLYSEAAAALSTPPAHGCINCHGEHGPIAVEVDAGGPFCQPCWEALRRHFSSPPAPPETGEVRSRTIEGCICPECGPTWIDEDGCCRSCGADTEPGLVQITMTAVKLGASPPNARDVDCGGVGPVLPAVSVLEDIDAAFAALKSATGGEYSTEDHTVIDALVNARDFIAAACDPREAPPAPPRENYCYAHDTIRENCGCESPEAPREPREVVPVRDYMAEAWLRQEQAKAEAVQVLEEVRAVVEELNEEGVGLSECWLRFNQWLMLREAARRAEGEGGDQ